MIPRLKEAFNTGLNQEIKKELGLENVNQIPTLEKIVLNIGSSKAATDGRTLESIVDELTAISGQKPVIKRAKKSIAGFKIREGMPLGTKVTLRRTNMYEFLDRLINLALPNMRDFQGVSTKLDGRGNYNLGIKDWIIFPELDYGALDKTYGMNITIHTSTSDDKEAYELIKSFGMPFKKQTK